MTFCLICCLIAVKLHLIVLTDNDACGSGGLANSLGGASSTPHTCCERLQEQRAGSSLSFTSVLFYKFTVPLYGWQQNGQQVTDKSTRIKKMRRCQRLLLLYSK